MYTNALPLCITRRLVNLDNLKQLSVSTFLVHRFYVRVCSEMTAPNIFNAQSASSVSSGIPESFPD